MNKRGKTIAVVVGLGILGIGGLALAAGSTKKNDKKPTGPEDCPEGFRWQPARMGQPGTGKCVSIDDPTVEFCPDGQVFDVSTQSCRLPSDPIGPVFPVTPDDPIGPIFPVEPTDVDIDDYIKDFPTDGAFYKIKAGDFPGWATAGLKKKSVAQNQLASALLAAAKEFGGLSGAAALEWANDRRVNQAHTNAIYLANLDCGWNDMTAGTYGYCGTIAAEALRCAHTAKQKPGATGRAIRYLKMHADNIDRMKKGLAPARVVGIGSANKAGDGLPTKAIASADPGGSTSYPTKWLVGINRRVLWESDGAVLEFDEARSLPPDFIMARGFNNYAGASADLPKYGANSGGYNGEAVV